MVKNQFLTFNKHFSKISSEIKENAKANIVQDALTKRGAKDTQ